MILLNLHINNSTIQSTSELNFLGLHNKHEIKLGYACKCNWQQSITCDLHNKQDAREAMRVVFSVLTKRICMHKTNFLRTYSNIVLKIILNCMNMQIATQLIMMYNL